MTRTIQPCSQVLLNKAKGTGRFRHAAGFERLQDAGRKSPPQGDDLVSQVLVVFDSLQTLYATLNRLDYVLKRKIIETGLT